MRSAKLVLPVVGIATLLAAAALFQQGAPARYGLPKIEVLEPGPTGQRIAQDGIFGNFYVAAGNIGTSQDASRPAVLLVGGSEGGLGGGAKQMALSLQEERFIVLHLAYFGAPGQPSALERIPLELFDRALQWLKQQPGVDQERLAVVGACKGAEAALLVASRRSDLSAVVAGMPTSVAWNGLIGLATGRAPILCGQLQARNCPQCRSLAGTRRMASSASIAQSRIPRSVRMQIGPRFRSKGRAPGSCSCVEKPKPCGLHALCRECL